MKTLRRKGKSAKKAGEYAVRQADTDKQWCFRSQDWSGRGESLIGVGLREGEGRDIGE